MGRSKNKCFSMLTCAGVGGGGGDVAADPANAAADVTADVHCEEGKVLTDKSRWSFRRRSTRHRVLRNNENNNNNNKENPNVDQITENININNVFSSPKYSSATEKSVSEQEKPKENNNVVAREIEEKLTENDINNDKINDDNDFIVEGIKENEKEIDEKKEENNLFIKETEENLNLDLNLKDDLNLKEDLEEKELENNSVQVELTEENGKDLEEKELDNNSDQFELSETNEKDLEEKELENNSNQFELSEKNENIEQADIVIQARRETMEIENVVKIQALVRGFLVRSQMVGTLRCFIAIIKMQSMVRSHKVKGDSKICVLNENILLNGFASKIIDTMPKTKAIHIKCDPYKPNSTWEWLERWNYSVIQSNDSDLSIQNKICEESVDQLDPNQEEIESQIQNSEIESQIQKMDDESITVEVPKEETEMEIPKIEENLIPNPKFETEKLESNNFSETKLESNDLSETKLEEIEPTKPNLEKEKPINPNFAAAQMKFQKLSSIPTPNTFPSPKNNNTSNQENKNHNNIYNLNLLKATSECGTEISISSTLDSPDRSETEGGEIVLEIQNLEMKNYQNTPVEPPKTLLPQTPNPTSQSQPPKSEILSENNSIIQIEKEEKSTQSRLQTPQKTTTLITSTTTDLNETPSSQASVNNNKTKTNKNPKPKTDKTDKKVKHQHKKAAKATAKRSLNASPISDSHLHPQVSGDAEPRMSSSSSSLPSYMQATLSARAKACSGSVVKSPDLGSGIVSESNEKKVKRLSGGVSNVGGNNNIVVVNNVGNNKELSPRMQRSVSHESEKKGGAQSNGSSDKRWQI